MCIRDRLNINPVTEPEKKPEKEPPVQDPYGTDDTAYPDIKACSATDCTGLIPSLPQSEAALESYAEMYIRDSSFLLLKLPDSVNHCGNFL